MKEGFYTVIAKDGWNIQKALTAAIEKGKEVWNEETEGKIWVEDYRTLENCTLAFAMWIEHFAGDEGLLKVIEPEVPFKLKAVLTEEEKEAFVNLRGINLYFTGKIDLEIELNGRYWIVEDKTTGQSLAIQSERLRRSAQFIGYNVAGLATLPKPPEGMLVTMHQLSAYKSRTTGLYGSPKVDFKRIPEIYSQSDFQLWRQNFLATANDVVERLRSGIWDMNFDACYNYGRCEFFNLCAQQRELGDEILDGYKVGEPWDVLKGKEPVEGIL